MDSRAPSSLLPEEPLTSRSLSVDSEWAPLREVVVGHAYYRIVKPFPEEERQRIGVSTWETIKEKEGLLLSEAFPERYQRAREQIAAARAALEARGVLVHAVPVLEAGEEGPADDGRRGSIQCFPRDPWLVVGDTLLELSLSNPLRHKELLPLRRFLHQLAPGLSMRRVSMAGTSSRDVAVLEGGDCLVNGKEILVGMSGAASNLAGLDWLRATLPETYSVTPVALTPGFAHLDVAMALVCPGLGVRCPEAFPDGMPSSLSGWEWVDVSRRQAIRRMAINILPLSPETTLVVDEADDLARELTRRGQEVLTTPFSAVTWLGGGLRCWTQPLIRID